MMRGTCAGCGGPLGISNRGRPGSVCAACVQAAKEARWREIQRLWAAGLSLREIAAQLGISHKNVGAQMGWMRAAGWDLPHRYDIPPGREIVGRRLVVTRR
jgi:FixJ family two-component response regulator